MPRIGITMGDPAGIGPEVIVKSLAQPDVAVACNPIVIGDAEYLRQAADCTGCDMTIHSLASVEEARPTPGVIHVLHLESADRNSIRKGQISAAAGRAAHASIVHATSLALGGSLDALVTAPIHKEALRASGCSHPGHTELLADLSGVQRVAMMLVAGHLRVSHVTTHLPLRDVCDRIRKSRIVEVIGLTHQATVNMGVRHPRIAVAGLNPHAGEGGLFGREEVDEIVPAIDVARSGGIDVVGPIPPDTVFYLAWHAADLGEPPIDAVVAMYHDQGHIPVKLVGFMVGVNVTLGLPFVRTSPDHGTAFDKAGKGTADQSSMTQAILLAASMARARAGPSDPTARRR